MKTSKTHIDGSSASDLEEGENGLSGPNDHNEERCNEGSSDSRVPALDRLQRFQKRAFDIIVATVCLAVLAFPMILIAVMIKLDSRGPVLFRQERIGFCNRTFMILKFRTMVLDESRISHEGTAAATPTITQLGKFLRQSSADELPQLINVICGDMSIVGPRPHAAATTAGDKLFWELDERYWERHAVKPGMTGLAQVRGFLGNTVKPKDFIGRLKYDLEYIVEWSFWVDIKIIMATVKVVIWGQDKVRQKR